MLILAITHYIRKNLLLILDIVIYQKVDRQSKTLASCFHMQLVSSVSVLYSNGFSFVSSGLAYAVMTAFLILI